MSRMQLASLNEVKVYNLSAGKSVPQWLTERQRRNLAKDENYQGRVELIQDLEFPTASQLIKQTVDGHHIVATGTYPPAVRVYEVAELSMKFERRLTAEVIDFLILSEDTSKLVFLQNDRTIAFHAAYGSHYATRIPTFGRSLAYHSPSCDLYTAASGNEIYRLNLDEGRFRAPLATRFSEGINTLRLNPIHHLLGAGGESGVVEFYDTRKRDLLSALDIRPAVEQNARVPIAITALEFDCDGLTYCLGTNSGHCLLYDLRSARSLCLKEHQYALPITSIRFHHPARKVLSADAKVVKIWERDDIASSTKGRGQPYTNIETPAAINDLCVIHDARGGSGLLLMAGEQERVMTYYVPALGPAPRWCSFLDSITEELEEPNGQTQAGGMIYDDYKFVTQDEAEKLSATNLIGTPLMRSYMHGYFLDAKLYHKLKAVSQPTAYEEWRKKQIRDRMEAKRASRISFTKALPTVNRALAERLLKTRPATADMEAAVREGAKAKQEIGNPLGDERFKNMFLREEFQVDEEADDFKLRNPSGVRQTGPRRRKGERQEGSDGEGSEDDLVVHSAFRDVESGEGGRPSSSDDSNSQEEDEYVVEAGEHKGLHHFGEPAVFSTGLSSNGRGVKHYPNGKRASRFMEADPAAGDAQALLLRKHDRREEAKLRLHHKQAPLKERVKEQSKEEGNGRRCPTEPIRGKLTRLPGEGGLVRELTYMPAERRGQKGQVQHRPAPDIKPLHRKRSHTAKMPRR